MPYETKPMKKQWLEVQGIMTPVILPQIWNHELQDWVVTSEQNPLPTQVTGSNVELIKKLTYEGGTRNVYFGEDVSTGASNATALDISPYSELNVLIENNSDKSIDIDSFYFSYEDNLRGSGWSRITTQYTIPSSGYMRINSIETPDLEGIDYFANLMFPFFIVRLYNEDVIGEGGVTITFVGRKY